MCLLDLGRGRTEKAQLVNPCLDGTIANQPPPQLALWPPSDILSPTPADVCTSLYQPCRGEETLFSPTNARETDASPFELTVKIEAGPAALTPLKSVAVASSIDRPCPPCKTSDSPKKTRRLTVKSLQEEAETASNWIWQSSCSAPHN